MVGNVIAKKLYCIYCSNIFLSSDRRSTELCGKHPSGYKGGVHNCREFLSIADRIKAKVQKESEAQDNDPIID